VNCKHVKSAALEIALACGKLQMRKFGKKNHIRWKGKTDPVTEVDVACEKLIAREIRRRFLSGPKGGAHSHAMVGEEGEGFGDEAAEYVWYCDPIDGTVNFSHGLPLFCVSIGVYWKGKPLIGVVHAPALGETYVAEKGKGARLNGKKIRVSAERVPMHAATGSGFAYKALETGENMREWMHVLRNFQSIRRIGSAAIDLAWVAAGRLDCVWVYGLKPWDMAAGYLLVHEAGGKVTDLDGKPFGLHSQRVLATNKKLHPVMVKTLKRSWKHKLPWPPR
jgi:myo-inositol-1(or 4)-monophosphatase